MSPAPLELPEEACHQRLDRAICEALAQRGAEVSVREIRKALKARTILVDGRARAPGDRCRGGEEVRFEGFVARAEARVAPDPDLLSRVAVLHDDPRVLALDKPSGIATHPISPNETGTLLGAAIAFDPAIAEAGPPLEGGAVHRLDIGTSGVVVFARQAPQRSALREAFGRHGVLKTYWALVRGDLPDEGVEARAIAPGPGRDRVRVVDGTHPDGLAARSEFRVVERFTDDLAWVEVRTRTGRRHQVRVHLAAAGAPIVGDPIYGAGSESRLSRLGLHAAEVSFDHGLSIRAPVRGELADALEAIRAEVS